MWTLRPRKVLADELLVKKIIGRTSCGIQPPAASFAFEVLCLLVINENLEIVKVTLAVIAPWSRKDFFHVGMTALLLRHREGVNSCLSYACKEEEPQFDNRSK